MTDSGSVMDSQEYEEVPEEVVETSFMCGECFLLFPTTEDFSAHQCQVSEGVKVEDVTTEDMEHHHESTTSTLNVPQSTDCVHIGVWEAGESEAAMEEAVASILGERMKRTSSHGHSAPEAQLGHSTEGVEGEEGAEESKINSILVNTAEESEHMEGNVHMEAVEIPTTNLYMYDNPVYLNRLMKDNTFGRRVRHDAPYSHRLGPWDNKSSRFLIQLLGEYPKAYFILDKECKRTEAWEIIRIRLAEAGYQFTVLQIRMRWRELCKKYRNTVNHNDMYNTRKTCQFFDELNVLFGVWDHPATLLLIRQLEANGGKPLGQNGGTRMRIKVWEHIRQVLASHGYKYTPDQVQGRWSNLVTLYQRMVEHNSRPHNEPITIAFKDHIERIFNYVPERNSKWQKIMEKRGKTPKAMTKKWTEPVERKLLTYYHERVYRFNNDHTDNNTLWKEIVQKLQEEAGYTTTIEKVRTRFYELTKQFSLTEQHNSQPGTIRRECKHHDMLSEIYSIYNFWPHDRSTIKMEKTNTIRMRQVNAQLMWSEDQSRTLLQLYPQILVSHITNGDHQPMEELWLQLAKAYMNAANDRKQCYEIEEHIALLRRGYRSQNPFPFVSEMQLLEEAESTLGFVQDALPIASEQLVSYWSHRAAHLLLDLVVHHRHEGVKNSGLFEVISRDLTDYGYRYTGEECRVYYSLLRQLYTNRLKTIRRNKELIKPFPYMDKMAEVDAVVSQPKFTETPQSRLAVLSAAASKLKELNVEGGEGQRDYILSWLVNLKMFLKCSEAIHPPPSVKSLARILAEAVEDSSLDEKFGECCTTLGSHLNLLKLLSGKGSSSIKSASVYKGKRLKATTNSMPQPKYGTVQWTERNLLTMLTVIKEWKLLCHDDAELEVMLGCGQPLWREVASRLSDRYRVDPNKCYERFTQLCREYKSVVTFNARLGTTEGAKSVVCEEILEDIMSLYISHDAQMDLRDKWWASDEGRSWSQDETLELIFTLREVWTGSPKVNWDLVSHLMGGSRYKRSAESCQERFHHLYKSYQTALEHNQLSSMRTRRRPPFYYKLKDLFGSGDLNSAVTIEPTEKQEICLDKTQVLPVLVTILKKMKGHQCHSVPRRPLLLLLAQHLNEYFQCTPPIFYSYNVWGLLVHLHQVHYEAVEHGAEVQDEINLRDLWQKDPKPLVAYGLHALPMLGWEKVCSWNLEETCILIEAIVNWELQQLSSEQKGKAIEMAASELLKAHGYEKTKRECQEHWQYIVTSFRRGGYRQFKDQINLVHLLSPSMVTSHQYNLSMLTIKNSQQQQEISFENCMTSITSSKIDSATMMHQQQLPISTISRVENTTHTSKKMRIGNHESNLQTEDELDDSIENSISGNIASYVKTSVPHKNQVKSHVQIFTDELKSNECVVMDHKKSLDITVDKKNKHALKNLKKQYLISRQKCSRGRGVMKSDSSPRTHLKPVNSESTSNSVKSSKDKVQVEVLSITENQSVKLIECQTVPGITPTRTIKLHYPADHPLPLGVRHLYIPRTMVHPETVHPSRNVPSFEASVASVKSDLSSKVLSMSDEHELDVEGDQQSKDKKGVSKSSALTADTNIISDDGIISELLSQYSQHCQQEKQRLFTIIQESNRQHISLLKDVLSVFQEFKKIV